MNRTPNYTTVAEVQRDLLNVAHGPAHVLISWSACGTQWEAVATCGEVGYIGEGSNWFDAFVNLVEQQLTEPSQAPDDDRGGAMMRLTLRHWEQDMGETVSSWAERERELAKLERRNRELLSWIEEVHDVIRLLRVKAACFASRPYLR